MSDCPKCSPITNIDYEIIASLFLTDHYQGEEIVNIGSHKLKNKDYIEAKKYLEIPIIMFSIPGSYFVRSGIYKQLGFLYSLDEERHKQLVIEYKNEIDYFTKAKEIKPRLDYIAL